MSGTAQHCKGNLPACFVFRRGKQIPSCGVHIILNWIMYVGIHMVQHRRSKDVRIDPDVIFGGGKQKQKEHLTNSSTHENVLFSQSFELQAIIIHIYWYDTAKTYTNVLYHICYPPTKVNQHLHCQISLSIMLYISEDLIVKKHVVSDLGVQTHLWVYDDVIKW